MNSRMSQSLIGNVIHDYSYGKELTLIENTSQSLIGNVIHFENSKSEPLFTVSIPHR